jgi:hypothetical protein
VHTWAPIQYFYPPREYTGSNHTGLFLNIHKKGAFRGNGSTLLEGPSTTRRQAIAVLRHVLSRPAFGAFRYQLADSVQAKNSPTRGEENFYTNLGSV